MTFNHLNRRTHLYLALALMPWFLIYALSALAIQHRTLFSDEKKSHWIQLFERPYDRAIAPEADLRQIGAQILADADMDGLYRIRRQGLQRLIINRFDFFSQTRLTYFIAEGQLLAEDQHFRLDQFLIWMHIRAGFQQESLLSDLWAVIVDLVCLGFIIWVAAGLYMWWQLTQTRRWGILALSGGLISFLIFVLNL